MAKRSMAAIQLALIGLVLSIGIPVPCECKTSDATLQSPKHTLEAAVRGRILGEAAAVIRDNYADPEAGEALADSILTLLQHGGFDSATDADKLVARLMAVIRARSQDRHFVFRVGGGGDDSNESPSRKRSPHGLRASRMLEHGIAYLEFDGFPGDEASLEAVKEAMDELPEVRAIVFDIRDNNGGSGDMVVLLCNQLLEENTLLYTFSGRSGDQREVRASATERHFGSEVPVFILTSGSTLSAAEAFANILQDHGRATVVGERTAGMANPSRTFPIGDAYELTVPFLLMRYGRSGGTHAGIGIEPDMAVPAGSALEAALEEAKKALGAEEP
ncbi:MAG: S41 family peptidase [Kiritimatiellae bacterium]|nr:S41 family peptidase [Kiritimatiellia bacterium]